MTQLVIVGGGPSGITAALEAARAGIRVTLVTAEKIGGRATWHSLLPSKVFLHSVERFTESNDQRKFDESAESARPNLALIKRRIVEVSKRWSRYHSELLSEKDVNVLFGRASIKTEGLLELRDEAGRRSEIAYEKLLLATGSVPIFLPQLKPDGKSILAPRLVGKLTRWPEHIVVIGAGATGSEYAYLFAQMGSQVTWVTDMPELLPRFDQDISRRLETAMESLGATVLKNTPVTGVVADMGGVVVTLGGGRALAGSHAFIAIGRKADLAGLNLDAAGISYDHSGIHVNAFAQTSNPNIYAAGDAGGIPYTVNKGQLQAYVAARHIAGLPVKPVRTDLLVEAVYTQPMLAQVGLNEKTIHKHNTGVKVTSREFQYTLDAQISGYEDGVVKVLYNADTGKIVGGSAAGVAAADKMAVVATSIKGDLGIDDLAQMYFAHPTGNEIMNEAARNLARPS